MRERKTGFIRHAGDLSAAVSAHRGPEEIGKLLAYLEEYTVNHFRDEEAIFPETHYSGADEHLRQHRDCVEEVGRLKACHQEKGSVEDVAISLPGFLTRWLIRHIRSMDGEPGECFRSDRRQAVLRPG